MATKIRAHNLHTDVKTILDSKATTTQLAAKADSDTVVAALATKLTASLDWDSRPVIDEHVIFENGFTLTGPSDYWGSFQHILFRDSAYNLTIDTLGSPIGQGGSVVFRGLGNTTHLIIDRQDNYGVSISGPLRLADSRSITLGADSDLTITHDGTNNIINSRGSGDLFIQDSGVSKLAIDANGIIVYGAIRSADSGTPTITSPSDIIFNVGGGNGVINSSGSKITNLGNPVNPQDAAPKSYVDSVNYTDSAVDTHLNTDSATAGEVLSWNGTDYNWTSQSGGGAVSGDITVNNLYVDSDIKHTLNGSIKSVMPPGSYIGPTGTTQSWPEHTYYEQKVYSEWAHLMLFGSGGMPFTLYENTRQLMGAEITIHAVTYNVNAAGTGYDSDFADSQLIQGYLMHNHTTATFTETSNTCTDPGVNLINLSTIVYTNYNKPISMEWSQTQPKTTVVTIRSRSAMSKPPFNPYG